MDMLMEFLQLTESEAKALAGCAPRLLGRVGAFANTFDGHLQRKVSDDRAGNSLSDDQRDQLVAIQANHYRELVALQYTADMQQRMVEVGELYYRWGLPPMWIMSTSALFAADFEAFATNLTLPQRRLVMAALYKRLRRDEVWQLKGYGQAADSVVRKLEQSPLRDALTGLLNQDALNEMLPGALVRARRHGSKAIVGVIQFDALDMVDDAHGQAASGTVLQQLADRLQRVLRSADVVVRRRDNSFVFILEDIYRVEAIAPLLERLETDLNVAYTLSDTVVWQVPLSIGITVYPDDNVTADELLRHAEEAMHKAHLDKPGGGAIWSGYRSEELERLSAERALDSLQVFGPDGHLHQ